MSNGKKLYTIVFLSFSEDDFNKNQKVLSLVVNVRLIEANYLGV